MKVTAAQIREMRRESLRWTEHLQEVPRHQWPASTERNSGGALRVAMWRSRKFLVQGFDEGAGLLRLSVNRVDWDERARRFRDDISWDDLQRLKAEAGYPDRCAMEVYPPAACVVNVANMRHIFVLQAGQAPPFMWNSHLMPVAGA